MYREKLDAYLDKMLPNMLEDLKTLVRIDSQKSPALEGKPFGEGSAAVIKAAGELMESAGLTVTNYDNYVITGDFSQEEKALDILAHLDVVPVTDEWTVTQPFEPLIVGDRIYGRGTADDKGPAIAALYALRAIKELGIPMKYSARLILGSDEECGSSDLRYYYQKESEAKYSFTPDADFPVINIEKARLANTFTAKTEGESAIVSLNAGAKVNVVPANASAVLKGVDLGKVEETVKAVCEKTETTGKVEAEDGMVCVSIKGMAAHGSTPELGKNAATVLLTILDALKLDDPMAAVLGGLVKLFPHGDTTGKTLGIEMADEISGALSMNLGVLKVKDGELFGEFDVRAPLCANDENLTEVVDRKLSGIGITMDDKKISPAHHVPADSYLVRTLLESYERYTGIKGEPLCIGGGTYVHHLERGVAFGCMVEGVDNHMHGDDEFMEISNLLMSAKIFADVIVKLCNEE